ncbi:unnamed protein product [Caenorhabditis angaria]|uniref:HAT C-terminal dimerisation domain-containing protein n=1 Tax=Caenorhabditis angaria TaxID=860376 RepID=A0A9P1NCD9_9PELO|nr:unnamed protein product [Caenorhabditis angaria]
MAGDKRDSTVFDAAMTEKMLNGETVHGFYLEEVEDNGEFRRIKVSNGVCIVDPGFKQCIGCEKCYKGEGGHTTRHARKCTRLAEKRREPLDKKRAKVFISEFVINSGSPIAIVENSHFREMIKRMAGYSRMSDEGFDSFLPKRTCIRDEAVKQLADKLDFLKKEFKPLVEENMISLASDFGKVNHDFYSVKISFIHESFDNSIPQWSLKVVPIGMKVVSNLKKDASMIHKTIADLYTGYDWDPRVLEATYFCADSAKNMQAAGNYHFRSYIRCLSHFCNTISLRIFQPYANSDLSATVKSNLDSLNDTIDQCIALSKELKPFKSLTKDLPAEIHQHCETRWLSRYAVVLSILTNLNCLCGCEEDFEDQVISDLIETLALSRRNISLIVETWKPLQEMVMLSQEEKPFIHKVLPLYAGLLQTFHNWQEDPDDIKSSIGQSAMEVLLKNQNIVGGPHCLSYQLDPRRVPNIQEIFDECSIQFDIEQEAMIELEEIVDILGVEKTIAPQISHPPSPSFVQRFTAPPVTPEFTFWEEYQRFMLTRTNVDFEFFWPANKTNYPKLYHVAKKIFGIIPSEATNERAFSQTKRIYTSTRGNLSIDLLENLLIKMSQAKHNLIHKCSFNGKPCNIDDDFKLVVDPTFGNCFVFNHNRTDIKNSVRAGPMYGLRVMLFVNASDYLPTTEAVGIRLAIHDKNEFPFPDTFGYSAPTGFISSFGMRMKKMSRLPHPYGDCIDIQSGSDYIYKGFLYSTEGCYRTCFQNLIINRCGCSDPRFPTIGNVGPCEVFNKNHSKFIQAK